MFDPKNLQNDPVAMAMISMYAGHKLAEIKADPSMIRNLFNGVPGVNSKGNNLETNDNILSISGYSSFYSKLEELKQKVELILEDKNEMNQVRNLLTVLLGLKRASSEQQDKKIIFRELIRASINKAGLWAGNPQAIEKYNQGACMIDEWVDFFLSYTNRDQPDVNNSFSEGLQKSFKRKDWDNSFEELNMLAKLFVKYMRQNTLNVYFDQQSMVCGDDIEEKVYQYCNNTFSFAQLLQWPTFSDDTVKKNWCVREYRQFMDGNKNKKKGKYFLKTDDIPNEVEKINVPDDWRDWVRDAIGSVNLVIPKKKIESDTLREQCGPLAMQIKEVRNRIIMDYLTSIA